jgi:hypothetical protein
MRAPRYTHRQQQWNLFRNDYPTEILLLIDFFHDKTLLIVTANTCSPWDRDCHCRIKTDSDQLGKKLHTHTYDLDQVLDKEQVVQLFTDILNHEHYGAYLRRTPRRRLRLPSPQRVEEFAERLVELYGRHHTGAANNNSPSKAAAAAAKRGRQGGGFNAARNRITSQVIASQEVVEEKMSRCVSKMDTLAANVNFRMDSLTAQMDYRHDVLKAEVLSMQRKLDTIVEGLQVGREKKAV